MRSLTPWLLLSGLAVALGASTSNQAPATAPPLTPEQVTKLQAVLIPRPASEKWMEIPWLTDLWQARQKAAAEGKPILLWEMDGHPLGCV